MKTVDGKKLMSVVALLSLLVLICVYFLVFKKYQDMTDVVESEKSNLRSRLVTLTEYYNNRESYTEGIKAMEASLEKSLKVFPSDVREEDLVKLALDTLDRSEIRYSNVNVGATDAVHTVAYDAGIAESLGFITGDLIFAKRDATYANVVDYLNLKDVVRYINGRADIRTISSLSYTRGEDSLDGSFTLSFYLLKGTDTEYKPVNLADYEAGLYDLFKLSQKAE